MTAHYFPHDYHARHDPKLLALRRQHGLAGLGAYWCLVEFMYEQDGELTADELHDLAYDLRCEEELLASLIYDFGLFQYDQERKVVTCAAVTERLQVRAEKREKAQRVAGTRWGIDERRQKAEQTIFYVLRIYSEVEQFIKVGITSESVSRRYSGKLSGYSYELLFSHDFACEIALKLESEIAAKFTRHDPRNKFAGSLECYKIDAKNDILEIANNAKSFRDAIKGKERKEKESKIDSKLTNKSGDEVAVPTEKKTTPKKVSHPAPHPDLAEAWSAYLELRQRNRWATTDYSIKLLIGKLEKLRPGDPAGQRELLEVAIERGWRGIFEPRDQTTTPNTTRKNETKTTLADRYNDHAAHLADKWGLR